MLLLACTFDVFILQLRLLLPRFLSVVASTVLFQYGLAANIDDRMRVCELINLYKSAIYLLSLEMKTKGKK